MMSQFVSLYQNWVGHRKGLGPVVLTIVISGLWLAGCSTFMRSEKKTDKAARAAQYSTWAMQTNCDSAIAQLQKRLQGEVKDAYDLDRALADFSDEVEGISFMAYVHTDKAIRDEGSKCEDKSNKLRVEVYTRRDLYQLVKATVTLTPAQKRLVSEMSLEFEKNGLKLSDKNLNRFKFLKTQLTELETNFAKNLNEDITSLTFSAQELDGVTADFLGRLKKNDKGEYIVTTKSTDNIHVLENAKNPKTRRLMLKAYESRAAKTNTKILEQAILLRQEMAQLMGYKNWADYNIQGRMANDSAQVLSFLSQLKGQLRPKLKSDLAELLRAKRDMENKKAIRIEPWDIRYFQNQIKKRDYAIDDEVIREYFPKDVVMEGMFRVYSQILGVQYEEVTKMTFWSPDVKMYRIRDTKTSDVIGYFYTDFIPREGKYGHAAAFTLMLGRELAPGQYSQPVSAIVANFTPSTATKPSLLTHDEVKTLFHEFGHIMHQTLTRAPYASLSGTRTRRDFVEAPSQMLENWVWDKQILSQLSSHYQTKEKLPDALIEKMLAARHFGDGYFYSRQLMLGLFDMKLHTAKGAVNVNSIFRSNYQDVMTIAPIEGSAFPAGFGHMMGGYDAGYYGYLWSKVFSSDMFTVFKSAGLLDSKSGRRYRQLILESGNMQDPDLLLEQFIGRKANNEAFLKEIGL